MHLCSGQRAMPNHNRLWDLPGARLVPGVKPQIRLHILPNGTAWRSKWRFVINRYVYAPGTICVTISQCLQGVLEWRLNGAKIIARFQKTLITAPWSSHLFGADPFAICDGTRTTECVQAFNPLSDLVKKRDTGSVVYRFYNLASPRNGFHSPAGGIGILPAR